MNWLEWSTDELISLAVVVGKVRAVAAEDRVAGKVGLVVAEKSDLHSEDPDESFAVKIVRTAKRRYNPSESIHLGFDFQKYSFSIPWAEICKLTVA